MKKVLFFAVAALAAFCVVACDKPADGNDDNTKKYEVKTCAENLVLHFGFEDNEVPGAGVTFKENKGTVTIGEGYIGKGWTNSANVNTSEAYSKYTLDASKGLKAVKDITFTAWVKLNKECPKGAILSVNGSGIDWPAFIAYFDNTRENEGVLEQQVNGRLVFHDAAGAEQNLWLDTFDKAFATYGKWFQFAFTYEAATGAWALYVDGVKLKDAEFGPKIEFGNLFTDKCNALYVGAWATFVEGASAEPWQSFFAVSIDEIRVFNKALTEQELSALRKEEVAIALS